MTQTSRPPTVNLPAPPSQSNGQGIPKHEPKQKTSGKKFVLGAALIALIAVGVVFREPLLGMVTSKKESGARFQTHSVKRGLLRVTVTEDGNVESARNTEIKCQVEGGSTILEIIPEGSQVKAGTQLIKLDSSAIEEQLVAQRIAYEKARSLLIQAEEEFEVGKIAVREYAEGTYEQELQLADANIVIAKENLKNAESMLDHSQRMFRKGYINQQQLDSNRFAVERSKLDLDAAETARKVLVEFTKIKTVKELESLRESAEARMLAERAATDLEKTKLDHLQSQLERCTIHAPQDGMVIYAHERRRFGNGEQIDEGLAVRENQTIIRLPDLNELEVKVLVHETKVNRIAAGMPANIRIRDWRTEGTVVSVATQAEPGSWFSAQVKEYAAVVRIDDTVEDMGIKPGMTAEVEIVVAELHDVISVPLLGLIQSGRDYYCYVVDPTSPEGYSKRPVVVGMNNDRAFEIKDGLNEGDRVILNPRATIPEAREAASIPNVNPERKGKDAEKGAPSDSQAPGGPTPRDDSNPGDLSTSTDGDADDDHAPQATDQKADEQVAKATAPEDNASGDGSEE